MHSKCIEYIARVTCTAQVNTFIKLIKSGPRRWYQSILHNLESTGDRSPFLHPRNLVASYRADKGPIFILLRVYFRVSRQLRRSIFSPTPFSSAVVRFLIFKKKKEKKEPADFLHSSDTPATYFIFYILYTDSYTAS